jgi:hypothetical protein
MTKTQIQVPEELLGEIRGLGDSPLAGLFKLALEAEKG